MGQKVNPYGFRLGITTDHVSRWFSDKERYADYVAEDIKIRKLLQTQLDRAGVSGIEIERTRPRPRRHPHRPSGHRHRPPRRRGRAHPRRPREAHRQADPAEHPRGQEPRGRRSAGRPGHRRAALRPRGVPPRDAQGLQGASAGAKGIRIQVSGRLGGAEMSRSEFYREGRVPLHTLRANIDYGFYEAKTTFGRIGVKVWIYKGDLATRSSLASRPTARARRDDRGGDRRRGPRNEAPRRRRSVGLMLIPRKVKYRKQHHPGARAATGGTKVSFGEFGIQALTPLRDQPSDRVRSYRDDPSHQAWRQGVDQHLPRPSAHQEAGRDPHGFR
jgi:small subunit ribosomal protein S3